MCAVKLSYLVIFAGFLGIVLSKQSQYRSEKDFDKVRLDKKGFDKVEMIHHNWYLHSVKAIMGQLGKDLNRRLNQEDRKAFLDCLDEIPDRRDIVAAAKCLVEARYKFLLYKDRRAVYKSYLKNPSQSYVSKPSVNTENAILKGFSLLEEVAKSTNFKTEKEISTGSFVQSDSTEIKGSVEGKKEPSLKRIEFDSKLIDPNLHLKMRAEKYSKSEYLAKKRNEIILPRGFLLRRLKRSPHRLTMDSVFRSDSFKYNVKNMLKAPYLKNVEKTPIQKVTNLIRTLAGTKNSSEESWTQHYDNLLQIKKSIDQRAKDPGAKVYDMRMMDLVLGRKNPTSSLHDQPFMPEIVREAYDLLAVAEKSPKAYADGTNMKFLSPRFAPVMPDKTETKGKLSPSILSFYKDDTEEQILPIPKLLEATGLNDDDRSALMETIMEISTAKDTVKDAMKVLEEMNFFGMEGELKAVTEKIVNNFADLEKTFTGRQQKEIKRRGYTFMDSKQMLDLYDKQGYRQKDDVGIDLEEYSNLTRLQKEESLWLRIEEIAANETTNANATEHRRFKRFTTLSVLKPTVLSPYMFAPVYGLSVLGPTVLSPSIFSPLILNPSVLSPYVLSPAVGMPFILSPYLLSPYVLSPMVMDPFILSPYVLSPNVLNPYILSPLILSPLVLCPDVLSPMLLGGAILSPSAASPAVLSKSVLMGVVLSPSILS